LNPLDALVLGVVQGLTEFLPISSDGHLALFRNLLRVPPEHALALDVSLHVGTFLSILVFFRRDLASLAQGVLSRAPSPERSLERRRFLFICLATATTAAIGFALKGPVEAVNSFLPAAGLGFLLTTMFLLGGELGATSRLTYALPEMSLWQPLLLGAVQGLAVWPGLSRSGSTIGLALFMGWSWTDAGRFSFLMAIPALLGAMLLTAKDMAALPHPGIVALGALVSFATGLAALRLLMAFLSARRLWPFAVYTAFLAFYAMLK
jgi:undecaprenyl-diphosphatase